MFPLYDTHCHLADPAFDADRPAVLAAAAAAGVRGILAVGVDVENARRVTELCPRAAEGVETRAAVGIHPEASAAAGEGFLEQVRELAARPGVAAIGEIGLDFYRDHAPREVQLRVFEAHLELARELRLPAVIHVREAFADALSTLRRFAPLRGVLHCFSGTVRDADEGAAMGLHLGFGGIATYPKAEAAREAAARTPIDRLLLETDAPWLPPQGFRGKRNEPARVAAVYEKVAQVRGMSVEDLARRVGENARALFGFAPAGG